MGMGGGMGGGPSRDEMIAFCQRLGVDEGATSVVLSMHPSVQANIYNNYEVPEGTTNPSGRFVKFARGVERGQMERGEIMPRMEGGKPSKGRAKQALHTAF
eukprot:gnl/MRDRNA2_/MRDRNA2_134434_c0_seq1.p1 gnl/MRDRNA2_/MRDRNA2_134434_c0~~gnl/MRDRNA2_/MRDRNA2_134434_c0_seq1.p1  ORF type:complete len:101 (-),score=13.15 gnl/MRDRNA2_/MRDRNA2_134434_c0_seq1:72-374(-)